jgi:hypothetical protein
MDAANNYHQYSGLMTSTLHKIGKYLSVNSPRLFLTYYYFCRVSGWHPTMSPCNSAVTRVGAYKRIWWCTRVCYCTTYDSIICVVCFRLLRHRQIDSDTLFGSQIPDGECKCVTSVFITSENSGFFHHMHALHLHQQRTLFARQF